jgi:hypothetical protein
MAMIDKCRNVERRTMNLQEKVDRMILEHLHDTLKNYDKSMQNSEWGKFLGYKDCPRLKKKGSHRRRAKMKVIKTRILNESENNEQ